MSNFVQATKYDVHMYVKFEYSDVYRFLKINTSRYEL
jgi:hypothetical protein